MTIGRTWDIHYNIKWFYLSNTAVCCILSVLLWRYHDDGCSSDRNVKVIYNTRYMIKIVYRCSLVGLLHISAIYVWHLLHLHRQGISHYVFSFQFLLMSTFLSVTMIPCFCPSWYRILVMWSCTAAKIRVWYCAYDLLSATDHEIRQSG